MVNRDGWNYDTTLTVRVERSTKERLWEEAEVKGISFSEYVRNILGEGKLPNDLCTLLPQSYRERIEKQARREGKEPGEVVLRLITHAVPYALDHIHFGF